MMELEKSDNIILFIDELHTIVGAGGATGSLDAANIFKPALARGDIQVIGATTLNEYKKFIEKNINMFNFSIEQIKNYITKANLLNIQ